MEEPPVIGKYSLEREIARGGMGAIWVAFDGALKRRVAIKRMSAEHVQKPGARARFEREALAIAQLKNPHVVQIYDFGVDGDAPYIVMELLDGEDLQTRLNRQRKLPVAAAIPILLQAAKGLAAAHAAGIVHRDLKPANIFLAKVDTEEVVKVLDFGVAALSDTQGLDFHATKAGALLGTPHYMSPEQVRGAKSVDHRADLWSLGVVAYRALTGCLPFAAEGLGDLLLEICGDPVPPPTSVAADLGPEVDAFFERALAKDPAARFASARELAAAFSALDPKSKPARAAKILVVDDEPDVALLMRQRFRQKIRAKEYEFLFATDGEAALAELAKNPDIDVVLSDINMPRMDGLTLLGKVGEVNPVAKVVMLSAYGDVANIRTAMNRGAFDFLMKPVDLTDLDITVAKTVKLVRELRVTVSSAEENSVLRKFVSAGVVERLMPILRADEGVMNEAAPATVAFFDLDPGAHQRGETTPDAAVRALNAKLDWIVPEVLARGGSLDKFVGELMMTVFRGRDHATRAIEACLAARERLATNKADPVIVGAESGSVLFGGLGSRAAGRLDYTPFGPVVKLAAQLTRPRDTTSVYPLFIGEQLYRAVHEHFVCASLGLHDTPEGGEPLSIVYEVLGNRTEALLSAAKTVFADGLAGVPTTD